MARVYLFINNHRVTLLMKELVLRNREYKMYKSCNNIHKRNRSNENIPIKTFWNVSKSRGICSIELGIRNRLLTIKQIKTKDCSDSCSILNVFVGKFE